MEESTNLLVAELLATCAVVQHAKETSSVHSAEVKAFHALSELLQMLEQLEPAQLRSVQPTVEKALKEVLFGQFSQLCSSPSFYRLLGSIWVALFDRGDTRNLLAVANDLQDSLGPKSALSVKARTAVLHCLGELSGSEQGRILSGHLGETTTIVSKMYRSQATAGVMRPAENELRCVALRCVARAVQGSGSAGVSTHGAILKLLPKAVADKAPSSRASAAELALALGVHSQGFSSVPLDALVSTCIKGLDDSVLFVRFAFARTLGALLFMSVEQSRAAQKETEAGAAQGAPKGSAVPAKAPGKKLTNPFAKMAQKSAEAMRKSAADVGMQSRGFAFPSSFASLSARSKTEGPSSYTLESALEMLREGLAAWTYPQVLKRSDSQQAQDRAGVINRSHETRLAFVQAAVQLLLHAQQAGDALNSEAIMQLALKFAVSLCDAQANAELESPAERERDAAFRRATASYFIGSALTSQLDESGKIELARALLNACTHQEASDKANSDVRGKSFNFKRRNSMGRAPALSGGARPHFRYPGLFIAVGLQELAGLVTSLGDASLALNVELDFQGLLPLLEHADQVVRLETASLLHACAIVQPGYAAKGVLPLLQLIGHYQAEVAVAQGGPGYATEASLSLENTKAERTLLSLEGLVHGLCAFVFSASAVGRPTSPAAEGFLVAENVHLPDGAARAAAKAFELHHQQAMRTAHAGSSSLQSGDLKVLPEDLSMALLGYAKSMISRQHDGTMNHPQATARITACGWDLIGALVTLGPAWCASHGNLVQIFQGWNTSVEVGAPVLAAFASGMARSVSVEDLAALVCLQSALQALYSFVRCNQLLLKEMPAVARAVVLLVEQVLASVGTESLQGAPEIQELLQSLFAALFDIAVWLPRKELRAFKPSVGGKLQKLAMTLYLDGARASEEPHSLFQTPGLFGQADDILDTAMPELNSSGSVRFSAPGALFRRNWRFELSEPASRRLELLMSAKLLSPLERKATSLACMVLHSRNVSCTRVAVIGDDPRPGDQVASTGMALAPDPRARTRCMDACLTYSSIFLAQGCSEREKDATILAFVNVLKRNTASGQATVLRNVLAVLLGLASVKAAADVELDIKRSPWVSKAKGILCVALSSPIADIRRASALTLAVLTRVAGSNFGYSVTTTLRKKAESANKPLSPPANASATALEPTRGTVPSQQQPSPPHQGQQQHEQPPPPQQQQGAVPKAQLQLQQLQQKLTAAAAAATGSGASAGASAPQLERRSSSESMGAEGASPYLLAGIGLVHALMRREASGHDTRFLKNNAVYDLCKLTSQPVRTWALHSWQSIVETIGVDISKYVKPSLALINAHLLAVDGHPDRGGYGSNLTCAGAMVCLARLTNALLTGLGPELSRSDAQSSRFLNIWESLRQFSSLPRLQVECVRIVQQILLFQPELILGNGPVKSKVFNFLQEHVLDMRAECGNELKVAALHTFMLMIERDAGSAKSPEQLRHQQSQYQDWGLMALLTFEMSSRAAPVRDWMVPAMPGCGLGAHVLRRTGPMSITRDPLEDADYRDGPDALSGRAGVASIEWSWCDLELIRKSAQEFFAKLVKLSCRELKPGSELEWSDEAKFIQLCGLTQWMRLCRAIMTGAMTDKTGGLGLAGGSGGAQSREDGDSGASDEEDGAEPEQLEAAGALASPDAAGEAIGEGEGEVRAFATRVLSKCTWECKILAVQSLLQVLDVCRKYPVHCDLLYAKAVLKKLGRCAEGQFLCMHLQELLTGACQAANGQVQGAEIPQVAILGYCTLVRVVRMFAASKDAHAKEQSILRQYDMQLTATLGPGLSASASPLILPFACSLAVELLISGASTSANRVVGQLVPPELRARDDDDSDDDDDAGEASGAPLDPLAHHRSSARAELMLVRIAALARLWLFAWCTDVSSAGPCAGAVLPTAQEAATMVEQHQQAQQGSKRKKDKRKKDRGLDAAAEDAAAAASVVEKAMRKALAAGPPGEGLAEAWQKTVADAAVLMLPMDGDRTLANGALSLVSTEDAYSLFPVYLDTFWVVARAVLHLPDAQMEQSTLLLANVRYLHMVADWCPTPVLKCLLSTICSLLAEVSGDTEVPLEALHAIVDCVQAVMERVIGHKSRSSIRLDADAAMQAVRVVETMLRTKAVRKQICTAEADPDLAVWHRLVEVCLSPLQKSLGRRTLAAFSKADRATRPRAGAPPNVVLARIEPLSVAQLQLLSEHCPSECAAHYHDALLFACVAVLSLSGSEGSVQAARKALRRLCRKVAASRVSAALDELVGAASDLVSADKQEDSLAPQRLEALLRAAWSVGAHSDPSGAPDAKIATVVHSALEKGTAVLQRASLAALQAMLGDDAGGEERRGRLLRRVGPLLPLVVAGPDTADASVPAQAAQVLTQAAQLFPSTTQITVMVLLSLAEGPAGDAPRPEATRAAARSCIVKLATENAEQLKGVVQALPATAQQRMQEAVRTHLQAVQAK